MPRIMTAAMAEALSRRAPIALLAEIDHPDGTARFWTGLGPLAWDGKTFTGAGTLGAVSPIRYQSDIAIQEVTFSLSGVAPSVAAMLSGEVRNRAASVWLACLDERGQVVRDPIKLMDALLDYQNLKAADDGSVTIEIVARSGFYTLERALNEVWSPEDQKRNYPDDVGLDMISALQNQDVLWKAS